MQCCEGGLYGGKEILCDKEENHEGRHRAYLFIIRECDGERMAVEATWDVRPCKEHPKGAHVDKEYRARVEEALKEG